MTMTIDNTKYKESISKIEFLLQDAYDEITNLGTEGLNIANKIDCCTDDHMPDDRLSNISLWKKVTENTKILNNISDCLINNLKSLNKLYNFEM